MYKFKCCSQTENEISEGPLLFTQLETVVNGFITETLDLQQEFNIKTKFVNEQFLTNYKNEKEILNISNILYNVQQQFTKVEEELKQLECLLQQFDAKVQHLEIRSKFETFCVKNICGCGQYRLCKCKTERESFLELLKETNRKMEKLPAVLDDIKELQKYKTLMDPFEIIFAILNLHCNILNNTEKNICLLADKWALIELLLKQIEIKDNCCN